MAKEDEKNYSLGRRALGAAMAVPGAISGATLLGTQPDFPVYDSAKYGAKLMLAKNKKEERHLKVSGADELILIQKRIFFLA
jgi:hypothetical protein